MVTGYKTSRVIGFEEKVSGESYRMYSDRRWVNPFADGTPANPTGILNVAWENVAGAYPYLDLDARIWMFTNYYSLSPGMVSKSPGAAAMYVIGFTDSDGTPLVGASNYRVSLPANIPARLFWSVTLYEAENASGLANGQPFPSLGSKDKPTQNVDGSTDLYLGPKAPTGKEGNWLATGTWQRVFRHPPALRPDRTRPQQELEARRHREAEVNVNCMHNRRCTPGIL